MVFFTSNFVIVFLQIFFLFFHTELMTMMMTTVNTSNQVNIKLFKVSNIIIFDSGIVDVNLRCMHIAYLSPLLILYSKWYLILSIVVGHFLIHKNQHTQVKIQKMIYNKNFLSFLDNYSPQ